MTLLSTKPLLFSVLPLPLLLAVGVMLVWLTFLRIKKAPVVFKPQTNIYDGGFCGLKVGNLDKRQQGWVWSFKTLLKRPQKKRKLKKPF